jgi:hypothetical protein
MNFVDFIIVAVIAALLFTVIYFQFIKNKGKSACASCSNTKSNFVKEYYKCKCEGKDI